MRHDIFRATYILFARTTRYFRLLLCFGCCRAFMHPDACILGAQSIKVRNRGIYSLTDVQASSFHPHPLQAYLDISYNLIDDLDTVQDLPHLQVSSPSCLTGWRL